MSDETTTTPDTSPNVGDQHTDTAPVDEPKADVAGDAKTVLSAAAAGAASAAAKSAVVGAASGGSGTVAAAAYGAAKGGGAAILRTRAFRTLLAGAMTLILIISVAVPMLLMASVQSAATTQGGSDVATSQESLQLGDAEVADAVNATNGTSVPWELLVIAEADLDAASPGWTAATVQEALAVADPSGEYVDPRFGLNALAQGGYAPAESTSISHDASQQRQELVRETYVTALVSLGIDEPRAVAIFEQLQRAIRGGGTCPTPSSTAPSPGGDGSSTSDGAGLTVAQQQNVTTIIGIAKTMGGDDWEQLALAALVVAYTESRWRVLANDGVIDHDYERDRAAEYPLDLYPVAATSMDLEHDGIGSQYVALGMFQQMMSGSWGNAGESTYATDPTGVVARLMTAEWGTFAFLRAAMAVDGWQQMEPATLGEVVQVSGNGSATAANLAEAQSALDTFGGSPALPLPMGADGQTPSGGQAPTGAPGSCGNQTPIAAGDFAWPVPSGTLSSPFGPRNFCPDGSGDCMHFGMDVSAACYAPILAIQSGVVSQIGEEPLGAMEVWVDHGDGLRSRYVHMFVDGIYVDVGDQVGAGQEIAGIGSTGFSTGCHLHLEVWQEQERVDPALLVGTGMAR